MTDKGKEDAGAEVKPPESPTETPPAATPTPEEQLKALQVEVSRLSPVEESYKNLQRKYNKLYSESKQPPSAAPQYSGDDKLLDLMLQDRRNRAEQVGEFDPIIPRLEAELEARKRQQLNAEALARQQKFASDWHDKLTQKITDAGLDPTDERLEDVWEAYDLSNAVDGKFERADRKLDRILKAANPTEGPKEKGESESEKEKRIREDERRKFAEERGWMISESATPSASSGSDAEFLKKFGTGELPMTKANIDRYNKIKSSY